MLYIACSQLVSEDSLAEQRQNGVHDVDSALDLSAKRESTMKSSKSSSRTESHRSEGRMYFLVGISLLLAIAVLSYLLVRPSPERTVKAYIVSTNYDYDPVTALELITDDCVVSIVGESFQEAKSLSISELADQSEGMGISLSREMLSSMTIREYALLIMDNPSTEEAIQGLYGNYVITNCWIQNDTAFVETYLSTTDLRLVRVEYELIQIDGAWKIDSFTTY